MNRILFGAAQAVGGVALLAIPVLTLAATYQYVNTSGNLEVVSANSASEALALPTDRDPHSGVELVIPVTVSPLSPQFSDAGTYIMQGASADTQGLTRALVLGPDGTAALASDYENGQAPLTETGSWIMTGANMLQLTLTGAPGQTYTPAHVIIFAKNGATLTAITFDPSLYGSNGLTFTEQQ
jgi:hypothetical protein